MTCEQDVSNVISILHAIVFVMLFVHADTHITHMLGSYFIPLLSLP